MLAGLVFHASHRRSGQGTGMAVGDQGGQCRSVWPRWWKYVKMQGGSQLAKRYGHLEPFQHLRYSVLISGVYQGRVTMVSAVWYTPSSCSHGYRNLQITVKIIYNIQCNLDWWNIEPAMFLLSTLTIEVRIEKKYRLQVLASTEVSGHFGFFHNGPTRLGTCVVHLPQPSVGKVRLHWRGPEEWGPPGVVVQVFASDLIG